MPDVDPCPWGAGRGGGDPSGMDTTTLAAARIRRFLEQEPVVWLSTVRPDGAPHLVPIWFWWDGEAHPRLLEAGRPEGPQPARPTRGRCSPSATPRTTSTSGLIEGRAELLDRPTSEVLPPAHLAKYASQLAAIGLTADEYAATYSQVVRIVPDRPLGWHGRQVPRSARLAGAPSRSIDESARERPTLREWLGEPLARGIRAVADGVRVPVARPASL